MNCMAEMWEPGRVRGKMSRMEKVVVHMSEWRNNGLKLKEYECNRGGWSFHFPIGSLSFT